MIYPRLQIARDLLANDGVIFMSIDDYEVENLEKIAKEIFGPSNYVGTVIWERAFAPKNDAKYFSASHDFLLVFAKDIQSFKIGKLPRTEEANSRYRNPDNDPRGPWTADNLTVKTYSAANDYPIETPGGRIVNPSNGSCWRVSKQRFEELVADNRVYFGAEGNNVPRLKRFLNELQDGMTPTTIWKFQDVGHNQEGRQELKKLFDGKGYFDGPKPTRLLERILQIANLEEDSIVVDFFSGSATTAQAVMKANAADGGRRQFIMIQYPEAIEKKAEAYKDGYKTICEIGEDRIRRSGKKIESEIEEQNRRLELGRKPAVVPDLGFRVFKVDSTSFTNVLMPPELTSQASLLDCIDNVKENRTSLDLLFEVLPKFRIPYSAKFEVVRIAGKECFIVEDSQLVACFDQNVGIETIEEIAKMQPLYAVMRDSSMLDDATQANFEELFKTYSSDTICRVI